MDHLRGAGYPVNAQPVRDMAPIRRRHPVPAELQSCHTGVVEGYLIEGHVPADLVDRLIAERPRVAGIAVPGMPIGSPGMEVPGRSADRYQVFSFDADGKRRVFATR